MNAPHLEKEEVLKLLEKIHSTNETSQRVLSRDLNISLGKINFLIKVLIDKGLIKIKRFRNSHAKSSYLYHLTPYGIQQKTILTYRFLKRKIEEFDRLKTEIESLKKSVDDLLEAKNDIEMMSEK
ncbi:MAG: MarR family EPS-associated transcriptional regulator [Candidatus Omnitrophica bacterium]|nr:MarR family EPS-associated transcriptional regulator [Candidatus Omnitrophota bacterium]HOX55139.1 MarR family EPS-associated transcriptional regulator [Candidatus Omnitrophota bacterium]